MLSAEIIVVSLGLEPAQLEGCVLALDPEERARADRFVRPADRDRFISSHAALRAVLGTALDLPPPDLRFSRDRSGRPVLVEPSGRGLDFNLSHSGDLAVIGSVRGARIGVDVEVRRPLPDALRIARSHFACDEVASLEALAPHCREGAFFALWTAKEAVVKALGVGLSLPLADFSVAVAPEGPRMLRIAGGAESWTLAALDVGTGARATVAVTAPACAIRLTGLPRGWADKFLAK